MTSLPEFLLARYAEDEEMAEGVHRGTWTSRVALLPPDLYGHIVRQHPARVLADVEAKRRIVAVCDDYEEPSPTVLRLLALPYADHPDYRAEWKP